MSQPTSELKSVTVPADGDVPLALSDPSSVQLPEQGTGTSSATTNPLTAALPTLAHLSEYVPLPRATDHEANRLKKMLRDLLDFQLKSLKKNSALNGKKLLMVFDSLTDVAKL